MLLLHRFFNNVTSCPLVLLCFVTLLLCFYFRPFVFTLCPPGAYAIHNIYPAILSSCCQQFPVCLMSASRSRRQVYFVPPLSLAMGFHVRIWLVIFCAWLSQGVAKPSPSPLKDLYLYLGLVCSISEVFVAHPVHLVDSQNSSQVMVDKYLDPYQRGLVYSPRLRSVQQHGLYICVKQGYFGGFSN